LSVRHAPSRGLEHWYSWGRRGLWSDFPRGPRVMREIERINRAGVQRIRVVHLNLKLLNLSRSETGARWPEVKAAVRALEYPASLGLQVDRVGRRIGDHMGLHAPGPGPTCRQTGPEGFEPVPASDREALLVRPPTSTQSHNAKVPSGTFIRSPSRSSHHFIAKFECRVSRQRRAPA
jgi:hypothetical protein